MVLIKPPRKKTTIKQSYYKKNLKSTRMKTNLWWMHIIKNSRNLMKKKSSILSPQPLKLQTSQMMKMYKLKTTNRKSKKRKKWRHNQRQFNRNHHLLPSCNNNHPLIQQRRPKTPTTSQIYNKRSRKQLLSNQSKSRKASRYLLTMPSRTQLNSSLKSLSRYQYMNSNLSLKKDYKVQRRSRSKLHLLKKRKISHHRLSNLQRKPICPQKCQMLRSHQLLMVPNS